ncbi:MAG: PIF1 family DEAD/DEAH box helicase [Candidatus Pacebacteria bacterium]|nr:PIF1 family DEAD/DEAH box helicase [Candidatus Paceibacterota bacterium]
MTQEEALQILKSGRSVFLTGPAGSGKTYVLKEYIRFLRKEKKPVGITASTGVAATHLNGMTIHSWTGMGILDTLTKNDLSKIMRKKNVKSRICNSHVLIIDEISMLSAGSINIVEEIMRKTRGSWDPFGGIQVILCGDFFQLPPVNRSGIESMGQFAYHSRAWRELNPDVCYLTEQYRHQDQDYIKVLNAIRTNSVDNQIIEILNQRIKSGSNGGTNLYTHNVDADKINDRELAKLDDKEVVFHMHSSGPTALVNVLYKSCLASEVLILKKGAFVMFLRNNFEEGYVNGTFGVVDSFDNEGCPVVRTNQGRFIHVLPEDWRIENESGKLLASITQLPLRLAWAITIHKSQGMTIDTAEMDLSKCFEPGMGYVALSRVRTLKGISLRGINQMALRVSPEVVDMDKDFRLLSEQVVKGLHKKVE